MNFIVIKMQKGILKGSRIWNDQKLHYLRPFTAHIYCVLYFLYQISGFAISEDLNVKYFANNKISILFRKFSVWTMLYLKQIYCANPSMTLKEAQGN